VGYLGRLDPEKSPGLFLSMAESILADHPSARFVMMGYGSLERPLEKEAARRGLGKGVLQMAGGVFHDLPARLQVGKPHVWESQMMWSGILWSENLV
jgi:glycosyltransferase involved in cell wall biosynthesis